MGTFNLLFGLRRHWRSRSHPVYKVQRRFSPFALTGHARAFVKRAAALISVIFFIFTVLIALIWLVNPGGPASLVPAMSIIGFITAAFFGFVFLGIFLLPMFASILISRVIITEREGQTWDILLTTPIEWREIVLAKGAAALERLPPYLFVILWSLTSAFVMLIVTATEPGTSSPSDGLAGLSAAFLLMALLVVAGFQVYLWAVLIGLLVSLFTSNRQVAMSISGLASFTVSLFMWLFLILAARLMIMMFSGRFLMSYTTRLSLTGVMVLVVALLNEILLRGAFRLLIRHLGDGHLPSVIQST